MYKIMVKIKNKRYIWYYLYFLKVFYVLRADLPTVLGIFLLLESSSSLAL